MIAHEHKIPPVLICKPLYQFHQRNHNIEVQSSNANAIACLINHLANAELFGAEDNNRSLLSMVLRMGLYQRKWSAIITSWLSAAVPFGHILFDTIND